MINHKYLFRRKTQNFILEKYIKICSDSPSHYVYMVTLLARYNIKIPDFFLKSIVINKTIRNEVFDLLDYYIQEFAERGVNLLHIGTNENVSEDNVVSILNSLKKI